MNKFMKSLLVSALLVLLLPIQAQAEDIVQRLTRPENVTASNGDVYSEIRATCFTRDEPRYIYRKAGQRKWCVTPDSSECWKNKVTTAKRACVLESAVVMTRSVTQGAIVEKPKTEPVKVTPAPVEVAPVVEPEATVVEEEVSAVEIDGETELEYEQRMIRLEQEKIELKRKELELKKQQLELEGG